MNNLGWTTLEQSKKLVEAGLNPNTADMYYYIDELSLIYDDASYSDIVDLFNLDGMDDNLTPCWSLGALIGLMPDTISIGTKTYCLWINTISCGYYRMKENLPTSGDCLFSSFKYNNLNPIYECIVFLLENNYINKGETK